MSEQSNVPARLREGIDAAKRGDKITARRLLQQVLSIDGDNELALMWMASVVDSANERRFFLERALSINPNNDRAREALRRMGIENPTGGASHATTAGYSPRQTTASTSNTNLYLIAAAAVAIVVVAVIVAGVVSSLQSSQTPNSPQAAQLTVAALNRPTLTPTRNLSSPTPTLLPGIVVTLDTSQLTPLPPTFTATFTLTPANTATSTPAPPPLSSFKIVYADIENGASAPSIYQGNADGTGEIKIDSADRGGYVDIALDPSGLNVAFVRMLPNADGDMVPQLMSAPLDSLIAAKQLTAQSGTILAHPSWSPDGSRIIFTDNSDGDEEIWAVNSDGTNLTQLTRNDARDFDPQYSPDGKTIAFASDLNSPGFTEIYTMTAAGESITAMTNVPNAYSPAWSPDGSQIAYVSDSQGDGDIYTMDADGERPALVTVDDSGAEDRSPAWSPDSRWILFASNRDGGQFRWFAIDQRGDVQPVTVTGRNPQSLSFVLHRD